MIKNNNFKIFINNMKMKNLIEMNNKMILKTLEINYYKLINSNNQYNYNNKKN